MINIFKISALFIIIYIIHSCKKDETTVTDIDGNLYHTVTISTQIWMAENLKTTKYNDGTHIPGYKGYCTGCEVYNWYNDDSIKYKDIYGALYSWGVVGTEICPTGWHIPSADEWTELINYLGGANLAGGKLKETGTIHWSFPNTDADNSSGFTALPGGMNPGPYTEVYEPGAPGAWHTWRGLDFDMGTAGYWMSSTVSEPLKDSILIVKISSGTSEVRMFYRHLGYLSIRCIKD